MRRVLIATVVSTTALISFTAVAANASFPGRNGRIAFWNGAAEDNILGIRPDGTGLGLIVKDGSQPAWSPRGNRIAFKVTDPNTGAGSIWIARADGTGRHLIAGPAWDASQPAWAPDGDHLVFVRYHGGDTDLVIADVTTGVKRLVRNNSAFEFEPSWSPDGSLIALSSDRHHPDQQNIYVVSPDGSNWSQLTNSTYDSQPNWSPDGTMIAFQSDRADPGNNYDIFRMMADGSNVVRLTHLAGTDAHPSWSPDNARIVFAHRQTGIVVMRTDGSDKKRIYADASAIVSNPDWRPIS
jgi:Tol biopolymer transport system component